jgi:hypothetical protein
MFRNNVVAVGSDDRNGVAVVRNRHVAAERFDMAVVKMV